MITLGVISGMLLTGCKQIRGVSDPHSGSKAGEERYFAIGQGVELEFRWIPAGKFVMGSPPDEPGRGADEDQVPVKVENGYWIAATETTAATWQRVMGAPPKGLPTTSQKPVVRVSWFDCREFIKRLNKPPKGWKYDLPSEVEWEYACRAGSQTAYARKPTDLAWLDMNSGGARHPVGLKHPNAWSVRDMQGNVAEWCRDSVGPGKSEVAIRGGSWDSDFNSRAAARNSDTPFLRINRVGFRLVLIRDREPTTSPAPRSICKTNPSHLP